ncbi:MAG TPA: flavin reductase [Planosporangium sp.]|nr:flavin reductase [Planosporangium sp.]
MLPVLTHHLPRRPDWHCLVCGEEWPCVGARADLLVEYAAARASLGMYLAAQMTDALIDLGRPLDAQMYDRFLTWVRPR